MIKLNMGNVSSAPLPEGNYLFRIADANVGPNSKGNQQLNIKLVVIQPEEFTDRVVWDNFVLVDQSLWALQKFLNAVTQKDWEEDDMDLDENELIGLFVRGTAVISTWEGKERNKIREYFPDL